jgi:hypothetical protein
MNARNDEYFVAKCLPAVDSREADYPYLAPGQDQFLPGKGLNSLRYYGIRRANGRQPHRQHPLIAGVFRGPGVLQIRPGRAAPAAAGVTGSG